MSPNPARGGRRLVLLLAGAALLLVLGPWRGPASVSAAGPNTAKASKASPDQLLKIKNSTPFILQIYIAGIRVGWIKPFRTEVLKGLRTGYHQVYSHSEYGTMSWGPRTARVPGTLNITMDGSAEPTDAETALASRIYKGNMASLTACTRIAERRGEEVQGIRVEFQVQVDEKGQGTVSIGGDELGPSLASCYRSVVKQWKFPETGTPYSLSFTHVQ